MSGGRRADLARGYILGDAEWRQVLGGALRLEECVMPDQTTSLHPSMQEHIKWDMLLERRTSLAEKSDGQVFRGGFLKTSLPLLPPLPAPAKAPSPY